MPHKAWVAARYMGRNHSGTADLAPWWVLIDETGAVLVQDTKRKNVLKFAEKNCITVLSGNPPTSSVEMARSACTLPVQATKVSRSSWKKTSQLPSSTRTRHV